MARRVRLGHAFGEKAVTRRGGEARAATAVALSPVTVLAINRFKYAAIMKAVGATESADVADFLRDTELFPETRVSDEDLTELASKLVVVRAGPGDVVVAAGDHAKGAFFVRSGRAKVSATARVMVEPPDEVVRIDVGNDESRDGVRGAPFGAPFARVGTRYTTRRRVRRRRCRCRRFDREPAVAEAPGEGRPPTKRATSRWANWSRRRFSARSASSPSSTRTKPGAGSGRDDTRSPSG